MAGPKLSVEVILGSKSARDFASQLNKAMLDSGSDWEKEVKKTTAEGVMAGYKIALASGKSGAAMKKFLKEGITDVYAGYMTQMQKGNVAAAAKFSQILDVRTRKFKAEADSIAKAYEKVQQRKARTGDQKAQAMLGGAKGLDRGVRGGVGGMGGMGRDLVGRLKQLGQARQGRAQGMTEAAGKMKNPQKAAAAQKQAASMARAGKSMAGAAKALGTIGAVIGVVLLLVKAFVDLDNKIKDLRRSVIATTGAMEFGFGAGADAGRKVVKELDRMSDEFNEVGASSLGMYATTKQMLKVTAAISGAGRNMKFLRDEITKGAKGMTSYADITNIAIGYSKLLGESMETTGARIGKIAMETGFSIATIGEAFTLMTREAELAGFQTKRFFSTVIEATSGLLYYNVRLQDAAKLLGELSLTLGETMGTKVFQGVMQGGAKTAETALKTTLLTGGKRMRGILGTAAEHQTAAMYKDLGPKGQQALLSAGISGPEQFAEAMKTPKMREAIRGALIGKEGDENKPDMQEEATQVTALGQLIDAEKGTNADVDRAVKVMPTAAKMAMLAQPAGEVLGGKSFVQNATSDNRAVSIAFEGLLGDLGFGNIAADPQLLNALTDEFRRLEAMYAKEEEEAAKTGGEGPGEFQKYVQEHYSQDLMEDLSKEKDAQLDVARETAKATQDLGEIMEEKILSILKAIHSGVEGILGYLTGGHDLAAAEAGRRQAKKRAKKALEEAQGAAESQGSAEAASTDAGLKADVFEARAAAEQDPVKKKALEQEAAGLRGVEGNQAKIAEGEKAVKNRRQEESKLKGAVLKYSAGVDTPEGTAAAYQQARGSLGIGVTPEASVQEKYLAAIGQIDSIDPGNDPVSWAASLGGKKAFKELSYKGVRVSSALDDAYTYMAGPWSDAYQGSKKVGAWDLFGVSTKESQFETDRAAAYTARLVKLLDAEVQRVSVEKVQDAMILPGGNRQVITDPQDTIMAFKKGGPLAGMMGGGGGENTFNFYINGDKAQMSQEIMRVLKATGNA